MHENGHGRNYKCASSRSKTKKSSADLSHVLHKHEEQPPGFQTHSGALPLPLALVFVQENRMTQQQYLNPHARGWGKRATSSSKHANPQAKTKTSKTNACARQLAARFAKTIQPYHRSSTHGQHHKSRGHPAHGCRETRAASWRIASLCVHDMRTRASPNQTLTMARRSSSWAAT